MEKREKECVHLLKSDNVQRNSSYLHPMLHDIIHSLSVTNDEMHWMKEERCSAATLSDINQ
jgi:hypothetical protein